MSLSMNEHPAPDLHKIQELALSHCGLDLSTGKEQLIIARIGSLMRRKQLATFRDYYQYVVSDRSGTALGEMVDALTTNHTCFFRERAHFDLLQKIILPKQKGRSIRIWSAACSTGEEPYSIAFCLRDAGVTSSAEIYATDISSAVISRAVDGVYKSEELDDIPAEAKKRYFLAGVGSKAGLYKVRPEIRGLVKFGKHNLLERLTDQNLYDVIFCRNVMIYFNKFTREKVVRNLLHSLKPGGYLLIGHSETLNYAQHQLQYVCPAVYQLNQ